MKLNILLSLIFTVSLINLLKGQEYNCRLAGKSINFQLDTTKISVKFKENYPYSKRNELLKGKKIIMLAEGMKFQSGYSIFTIPQGLPSADIKQLLLEINNIPEVEYAAPLLLNENGHEVGISNQILLKLKTYSDTSSFKTLCKENGFTIIKLPSPDKKEFPLEDNFSLVAVISIPKEKLQFYFDLVKKIQNNSAFTYAEPNFITLNRKSVIPANETDPLLSSQWALARMYVQPAWSNIQYSDHTRYGKVKIAVIDDGVQLNHPDLVVNEGFDATYGSTSLDLQHSVNTKGSNGNNQIDYHGTACAGIILAQHNLIGCAGIALDGGFNDIKLMSVRVFFPVPFTDHIGNIKYFDQSNTYTFARGLEYAYQNGADILNNSWVCDESTIIEDAIDDACTLGRFGKGCIVFFGAGNSNSKVEFPASYPKTIAVGATNENDYRCDPIDWPSTDPLIIYGSNYGNNLDIAAPGNNIITTDLTGVDGKNITIGPAGDYIMAFSGTSAACPQAAGVMSLILKVNPDFTLTDARSILESTCEKVGSYLYTNVGGYQPNGTWCQEIGYGRINAVKAVNLALTVGPSGLSTYSSCSAQYAEDLMRDAHNNNLSASVNFKINNRLTNKVINLCNQAIYLNPIDRWLFTYEQSNMLCSKTKNMWRSAYKVYSNILKTKCDCRWLRLFIAVQECDENLILTGQEASQWFYFYDSDQSLLLETGSIRTINLKDYMPNSITLEDGKYYKIKIASFDNGKVNQPWCEYSGYVRVYKDDIIIQNKTINHDQFANNITIADVTVPSYLDIKVVAKSKIKILPNTTLKSGTYKIKNFDCSQLDQFDH